MQSAKDEPKFKIHVLREAYTKNFIIGDSNLRTIERKRLDKIGKTHVRTMAGAKVADVTASLKTCSARNDVRRIVLHVGGNDVRKHYTTDDLKADFQQLLSQVKRVFSTVDIAVTALLHRKPVPTSFTNVLNSALGDVCVKNDSGVYS